MKWLRNKLKGWKTIVVAVIAFLLPIADTLVQLANENSELFTREQLVMILALLPILMGYLRTITTTPVGKKE